MAPCRRYFTPQLSGYWPALGAWVSKVHGPANLSVPPHVTLMYPTGERRWGDTGDGGAQTYPKGDLGKAFGNAARIVRGDVGVEVITIDYGKWDMHSGLGDLSWGQMLERSSRTSAPSVTR